MAKESRPAADRIAEPWGLRPPCGRGAPWPVRVAAYLAADPDGEGAGDGAVRVDRWVPTASNLHSNGDAMELAVRGTAGSSVSGGTARDRVNRGRLDPKDL